MTAEGQKAEETTTVRIRVKPKERLANVARHRGVKENRTVTEAELTSEAVDAYCSKEERKLGIA